MSSGNNPTSVNYTNATFDNAGAESRNHGPARNGGFDTGVNQPGNFGAGAKGMDSYATETFGRGNSAGVANMGLGSGAPSARHDHGHGHNTAGVGIGSDIDNRGAGGVSFGSTPHRNDAGGISNDYGSTNEHGVGRTGPGIGDKFKGSLEKTAGKVAGNPDLQIRGEQRKTQGTNF
ncbi:hypothetical protein HGRIS_006436 [Hohenbuehelia grisea]|uniref:Uncharacterized protein n=1 Tax=Hohenbuehelia grisea TaxID=104357 RepID=A0ABR3K2L5_9AGAR